MKFGFTPEAEILNARLAMLGFVIAVGTYITTGQILPGDILMLVLALTMFGAFILGAVLTQTDIDDDDDMGGGTMIPITVPSS